MLEEVEDTFHQLVAGRWNSVDLEKKATWFNNIYPSKKLEKISVSFEHWLYSLSLLSSTKSLSVNTSVVTMVNDSFIYCLIYIADFPGWWKLVLFSLVLLLLYWMDLELEWSLFKICHCQFFLTKSTTLLINILQIFLVTN